MKYANVHVHTLNVFHVRWMMMPYQYKATVIFTTTSDACTVQLGKEIRTIYAILNVNQDGRSIIRKYISFTEFPDRIFHSG